MTEYKEVAKSELETGIQQTRVFFKRWIMLGIFVTVSMMSAFQWIMYSIVGNVISHYYQISNFLVECTSMLYMITYIAFFLPASLVLDKWGLRRSLILGALGTAVGAWIKAVAIPPNRYWLLLSGQALVASSQVFILSVPPRLAAVWFGADQVSTACSIGVFGNQVGIALGFLLTPLIVKYSNNMDDISADLSKLYYGVAGMTGISLLLVLLFFREEPPVPPSDTQAAKLTSSETTNFTKSLKNLLTNKGFLLLCLSYGINVGIFFALSTLLNQIILEFFPDGEEFAGQIGLLIIMSGIVGSAVSGFILDKTHKFKETSLAVYAMSLLGMVVFSLTIHFASKVIVIITSGLLGFFMTGYLPVGFEFGAELTYPESETTSAGILCSFAQVFGIVFTITYGWLFEHTGDKWANVFLCISLVVGTVVTAMIKSDLRRQYARCNSASTEEKK